MEKITKLVKHVLTTEERAEMSDRMLVAMDDRRTVEADSDNSKAQFKAKLEEVESTVEKLSITLRAGFEMRNKACWINKDFEKGRKYTIVEETGEIVASEALTPADLQEKLL